MPGRSSSKKTNSSQVAKALLKKSLTTVTKIIFEMLSANYSLRPA